MSNVKYDKFFTKKHIADKCFKDFVRVMNEIKWWNEKDCFYIEPSAGNGDFFFNLPEGRRTGIDILPPKNLESKAIAKKNFLTCNFKSFQYSKNNIVVIGNPPFGYKGNLALRFIEKASKIADTVAFILPVLFRKYSAQKNIINDFDLIYDKTLDVDSFYLENRKDYIINTTFQIWTRLNNSNNLPNLRITEPPPTEHPDLDIWQYNATSYAEKVFENDFDFAVLRQGYHGFNDIKYKKEQCNRKKQWILFKAHSEQALSILKSIDFSKLAEKNTTKAKGFGKADIIEEYSKILKKVG